MSIRIIRQIATPVHRHLRERKIGFFFKTLRPSPQDTLLDAGGGIGIAGEMTRLYEFFQHVTFLNIRECKPWKHATFVRGNALEMPFDSRSFDFVFSNAVIEHVGQFEQQKKMADEIRRVARKGYFVSTPNRWFPVDPHTYVPCLHLMPLRVRRIVSPHDDYWMLSPRMMRRLFPDASIFLTPDRTSIVAAGGCGQGTSRVGSTRDRRLLW